MPGSTTSFMQLNQVKVNLTNIVKMVKNLNNAHHRFLKLQVIFSLLSTPFFYSCTSTKSITYFQSQELVDTARYVTLVTVIPTVSKIQPDDILAIVVSSLSDESNLLFNVLNTNAITMSSFPGVSSGNNSQPLGYLVDAVGEVNIPLVGKVKLAGMTLEEASVFVKDQLSRYIKDPTVNVRQLNHKFTVIGEVSRPGVFNLLDNHTTIPEAIGIAGDLTVYGRRDNVMILRTINNKRELIKIDLTSRQVLNSPYYFIKNNDVIYVETRPGKITSTDRTIQILPIVLSVTSTVLFIASFLLK